MKRANSIPTATASGPSRLRRGRTTSWLTAAAALLLAVACGEDEAGDPDGGTDDGTLRCERDPVDSWEDAIALDQETVMGKLCPKEDEDWYAFDVPERSPIVDIELRMDNNRALVEATYAIWSQKKDGSPKEVVAIPDASAVSPGRTIESTHLLQPGSYFLVVRDQGDDEEDLRNNYVLSFGLRAQPDEQEPNDDRSTATMLMAGTPTAGYIASTMDADWYAFDVPAGSVVRVLLTMPDSDVDVKVTLADPDGNLIVSDADLADDGSDADLRLVRVLATAGTYYVIVEDDDGMNADLDQAYSLTVEVLQDRDDNEPNDHPDAATPVGGKITCGMGWSQWYEASGTIGSPGDNDWFLLDTERCDGGVIEAELRLGEGLSDTAAWQLQQNVQAAVTLVRPHLSSPCAQGDDLGCRELTWSCDVDDEGTVSWECEGLFNSCSSSGLCTGATVCLPGGACGANVTQRYYTPEQPPNPINAPPMNQALLTAPLRLAVPYYLRVGDFQADGGDPEALYSLRFRVRLDPDPADRSAPGNNPYTDRLTEDDLPIDIFEERHGTLTVHDATMGDTCNGEPGDWTSGALSYENDLDFWQFDTPCPQSETGPDAEGDCMLGLAYEVDQGATNPAIFVYHDGGRLAASFPIEPGTSGYFGKVGADDDTCFFAYHTRSRYTVLVRDQADDGRDWDPDQNYRFCIEKWSDTCQAPCEEFGDPDGDCGRPQ